MCTSSSKSAQIGCGITLLDQQAERLRSPHTRVNTSVTGSVVRVAETPR